MENIALKIFNKYPLFSYSQFLSHNNNNITLDPIFLLAKYVSNNSKQEFNNTLFAHSQLKLLEHNMSITQIHNYTSNQNDEQHNLKEFFDLVMLSLIIYYHKVQQLRTHCKDCEGRLAVIHMWKAQESYSSKCDIYTLLLCNFYKHECSTCKICTSKPTIISNEKLFPKQEFIKHTLINYTFTEQQTQYIIDNIQKLINDKIIEEEEIIKSNHLNEFLNIEALVNDIQLSNST